MSQDSIGDKVGYVVLERNRFGIGWNETNAVTFDTISEAVAQVRVYQDQQKHAPRHDTYAVARLELVMISRPDPADDPEGRALVQAIHDRKAQESSPRQVNQKYIENRTKSF